MGYLVDLVQPERQERGQRMSQHAVDPLAGLKRFLPRAMSEPTQPSLWIGATDGKYCEGTTLRCTNGSKAIPSWNWGSMWETWWPSPICLQSRFAATLRCGMSPLQRRCWRGIEQVVGCQCWCHGTAVGGLKVPQLGKEDPVFDVPGRHAHRPA